MSYKDEDIEFASRILTQREELNEEEVAAWLREKGNMELLDEIAAIRQKLSGSDYRESVDVEYQRLEQDVYDRKSRRMTLRWSVAASIILLVGLFVGRTVTEWQEPDKVRVVAGTERCVPGVKAELILSTGERVVLDRNMEIEGAREGRIRNDSVNGLNYGIAKVEGEEFVYNTMRVPVGGFYQLTLADGSKVWLNSMTELRFPVTFTGEQRRVYLKGEAYFEVTHDVDHPFVVETGDGMEVKVYGTEFNVDTYQEDFVRAVLVKGKVGIRGDISKKEVMLAPNQMAVCEKETGDIRVEKVDPYKYVAWKDGEFVFERETIEEIMVRLSRWYDVRVFYENESLKQKRFTGVISRQDHIEQVLRLIEGPATLRFEVKGNVVTVKNG